MIAPPKTSRKYRPDSNSTPYTSGDALDRPIMRDDVLHATVAHYAGLAGVDRQHLLDTLHPGEQVMARHIRAAASSLAAAGYGVASATAPRGPSPNELAADLASIDAAGGCLGLRGVRGPRAPRRPRAA